MIPAICRIVGEKSSLITGIVSWGRLTRS